MDNIYQLISFLESDNSELKISGNFRAISAIRFLLQKSYEEEFGNLGEICIFSETKKHTLFKGKDKIDCWEFFIPHTAISADFYSSVDRSESIWNFAGEMLAREVEIYCLDESGKLVGFSHKHGSRVISENAHKSN